MEAPARAFGCRLFYLPGSRDGYALADGFTDRHVFNPYYFPEDGVACACRACEPLLWKFTPLRPWDDSDLPEGTPSARNGRPWPDLDAEFFDRMSEFTPLW
jgi:hypothetical protein